MASDIGIVFCSCVDWDAPWERLHQLAWMFGSERPALFATNTGLRPFDLSQASRAASGLIAKVTHRIVTNEQHPAAARENMGRLSLAAPWVLPSSGDPQSAKINAGLFSKQMLRAIEKAGMKRAILWAASPTELVVSLLNARKWEAVIYDCVLDLPELYPHQAKRLLAAETPLVKRADIIFAASHLLERKLQRYGRTDITYLPNGLSLDRFSRPTSKPLEFNSVRRPIIGFLGAMQEKIFDMTLVANMAKSHPEWSVVLVGPIDKTLLPKIDDAPILLAGQVSYDDVPAYLRSFDVGIMPFFGNAYTRAINPLKIYEYLACGLPVVSTPSPELEVFGDLVTQVSGPDRFSFAIHAALEEGRQRGALRQQTAAQHNWDRRFAQVEAMLQNKLAERAVT